MSGSLPEIGVRPARREDLPSLTEIYNHEVTSGVSTFDTEPWTTEQRAVWFDAHDTGDSALVGTHPLLVATTPLSASGSSPDEQLVVGYASLSGFRDKDAYATTVELSVYVHPDWRGKRVASRLLEGIIELARGCDGVRRIVSVITAGNAASIALHKRFGFSYAGTLHGVAHKHGRWLDTDYWELAV